MVQFNPNIYMAESDRRERQGVRADQTFQGIMNMMMRKEEMDALKADKAREQAVAASQDPQNIFLKAQRGEQLSPEEQARYAYASETSKKSFLDPYSQQVIQTGGLPSIGAPAQPSGKPAIGGQATGGQQVAESPRDA